MILLQGENTRLITGTDNVDFLLDILFWLFLAVLGALTMSVWINWSVQVRGQSLQGSTILNEHC